MEKEYLNLEGLERVSEYVNTKEPMIFKGTSAEWDALTAAEQAKYNVKMITDDSETGEVVDSVTDGDMRAVTSHAVFDAIAVLSNRKLDWSGIGTKKYNGRTYFVPSLCETKVGGPFAGIACVIGENNGIALFGSNDADMSGFSHVDGTMHTVEAIILDGRSYFALRMSNDTDVAVGFFALCKLYNN